MPGTYTANEWSDENSHRQFPLIDAATGKDVTGNFSIPQTLMVDIILAVPIAYDTTKFYVKSLLVRRNYLDIEIGYDNGAALTVGFAKSIPRTAARNSTYSINPVVQSVEKDFEMLTGAVVIGSPAETVDQPGSYSFDPANTYIHSSRVMVGLACVQSIQVGAAVLSGNLVLKEGTNVSFDVDPINNEITVNATISEGDGGTFIGSDADIIAALTAEYGPPIISINGQAPDGNGDFKIIGADCTSVVTGVSNVTVKNPCAEPCCDKSVLTDVYGVLSQLNLRYAVLESYYQSIGLTLNQMQSRMVGLDIR